MSEVKIGRMVLGILQTNTYFIYREGCPDTVVIDPADQGDKIYSALERNGFQVKAVLLTHGHCDHIWGVEGLKATADVPVYAYEAEAEILGDSHKNLSVQFHRSYTMEADAYLKDGQTIELAGISFRVISTPGHTIGGCCFYIEEAGFLVSGDTLFQESTGRTDFATGSMSTLVRSIKDKLFVLPEDTKVYPGHGDSTTIAYEKKYNPFCV